jgi:hypothetical protein
VANGKNPMLGGQWGNILLGGQWKESNVWRSMGRHIVWWLMEGIQCLEVNGEAYCLVANGRNPMFGGQWGGILLGGLWEEKEKHHYHLCSFSPLTKFI